MKVSLFDLDDCLFVRYVSRWNYRTDHPETLHTCCLVYGEKRGVISKRNKWAGNCERNLIILILNHLCISFKTHCKQTFHILFVMLLVKGWSASLGCSGSLLAKLINGLLFWAFIVWNLTLVYIIFDVRMADRQIEHSRISIITVLQFANVNDYLYFYLHLRYL